MLPGHEVSTGMAHPSARCAELLKLRQRLVPCTRPVTATWCSCALPNRNEWRRLQGAKQRHQLRQPYGLPITLSRLLAGCSTAAASLFIPLLPSWSAESMEYITDTYLDPNLAETPGIMETLLIVVVTYFTVMMLYLWLSSFAEEDVSSFGSSGSKQPPPSDESELPPGFNSFLDANIRSCVEPGSSRSTNKPQALHELKQAQPLEGEDLQALKTRLAGGAAEALDLQIRDCKRLIRTKLLARKLGYIPQPYVPTVHGGSRSNSKAAQQSALQGQQQLKEQIDKSNHLLSILRAAALYAPGGLYSAQHRDALDALIDAQLDKLLPANGQLYNEEVIVRQVMRGLVGPLVLEEVILLIRGCEAGKQAIEGAGGDQGHGKDSSNHPWWALW
eukprot:GHRR01001379.1.p1 GENE.GHRR01001379.1~~GHRR01001379.1.p1  ORF type:complete len:389 (+),score=122.95 GHRR01001379.1:223-1389(+)